jgi:hypothetical protein
MLALYSSTGGVSLFDVGLGQSQTARAVDEVDPAA